MSKNSCEAAEKCRRHVLRMHMGAAELFAAVHGARLNFFAADAHGGAAELFLPQTRMCCGSKHPVYSSAVIRYNIEETDYPKQIINIII